CPVWVQSTWTSDAGSGHGRDCGRALRRGPLENRAAVSGCLNDPGHPETIPSMGGVMNETSRFDVIIIGTGAGGGTPAHRLAPSGKRILLLERGDYVPREKDNWSTRAVNLQGKYSTKEVWRTAEGQPLHPHTNYWVGGNTKFYGAALFRLRREDFGELKHWGGISPEWPIGYEDLEPYYTQAERLYHLHRQPGDDPTHPPAGGP